VFYSPFFVFFIFYINNSIQNTGDIKLTQIPLIGVVGLNKEILNWRFFRPKSVLSESFRAFAFPSVFEKKCGWGKDLWLHPQ
jgi:hypothetical protein